MLNKINHTQMSNDYLDKWMSKLQSSSTLVFLAIARKTIGWHKDNDQISQTQIMQLTGLSKNSVKAGIKELLKNDIITMNRTGIGKNIISNFEINYFNISKNDIINDGIVSKNDTISSSIVSKIDTTKESNINKEYKKSGRSPLPLLNQDEIKVIKKHILDTEIISPTPHSAPPPSPEEKRRGDLIAVFYLEYENMYDERLQFSGKELGAIKNLLKKDEKELKSKLEIFRKTCEENNFWTFIPSMFLSNWNKWVKNKKVNKLNTYEVLNK